MSEPTSSATSPSRKAKKHKKKKPKGTAAEALTDDVPAPSSAAGIGLPFLRTSISAEAGVDWGDAEMPARMQELERRHELLQWLVSFLWFALLAMIERIWGWVGWLGLGVRGERWWLVC